MEKLWPLVVAVVVGTQGVASAEDADPGAQLAEPIWIQSITATSTFPSKKNAYDPKLTVFPKKTFSNDAADRYDSAWCEGKPDEGIGEGITITFVKPTVIGDLSIKPGVWMTEKLFKTNNIITGLEVVTNDGRKLTATPKPTREDVELTLGGAAITSLTVRITSVQKGKMNDSCISEIHLDQTPVLGFDRPAVDAYATVARELPKGAWRGCDAQVMTKYAVFPLPHVHEIQLGSGNTDRKSYKHKTAAAFAKWCATNENGAVHDAKINAADVVSTPGWLGIHLLSDDWASTYWLQWRKAQWRLIKIE
jgi:hypothetical protein